MLPYEKALETILENTIPLGQKRVRLESLLGHALAQPLTAKFSLPRFDNSAVDGYGVKLSDLTTATPDNPTKLQLVGEIKAGDPGNIELATATAVRILTGAMVPPSVDAVIMQENCEEHYGYLHIGKAPAKGENIRRVGEEFHTGQEVLPAGFKITPPVVGLLASFGYSSFMVYGKPKVGLVITGDELVKPGHQLAQGQIYDSNSYALQAALTAMGIEEWFCYYARDTRKSTKQAFSYAVSQADVIVSAGGVSVGEHDYVKEVLENLGVKTVFWRIAMKPGKPVYFGTLDLPKKKGRKLIIGLPGNPVSALVTFHQLVKPALYKMMGYRDTSTKLMNAMLTTPLSKRPGRLDFVRAMCSSSDHGHLKVEPAVGQDSHMLSGLARANCLLRFGQDLDSLAEGARVPIDLIDWFD